MPDELHQDDPDDEMPPRSISTLDPDPSEHLEEDVRMSSNSLCRSEETYTSPGRRAKEVGQMAEDWPWFEHAFKDFLGCHQDYLRGLEEVDNPYRQGHIAGALTQCVEDAMGRRKLV